jgi:hypothetical protein
MAGNLEGEFAPVKYSVYLSLNRFIPTFLNLLFQIQIILTESYPLDFSATTSCRRLAKRAELKSTAKSAEAEIATFE